MKNLIILITLVVTAQSANAQCSITLYKTKADSKTTYTKAGESISKKVIEKLSPQCSFDVRVMSAEQKRKMDINKLTKRLKKLQGK